MGSSSDSTRSASASEPAVDQVEEALSRIGIAQVVAAHLQPALRQHRPAKRTRRSFTRPDKAAESVPDLVGRDRRTGRTALVW
jgi:hypothetical protein